MRQYGFRLSPEHEAKLQEILNQYGLAFDNDTDTFRALIDFLHRKDILNKSSTESPDVQFETLDKDPELSCFKRIKFKSQRYCVNRPPKMTELSTLDICRVCKRQKIIKEQTAPLTTKAPSTPPLPLLTLGDGRQVEDLRSPDYKLRKMCPPEIEKLLYFEQAPEKEAVRIRTKAWLPERDFRTVSQWILSVNGEYISNGKDSHFLVPYKAVNAESSTRKEVEKDGM